MSLGSFLKVLGSFGSVCCTGLLELFPEPPLLLTVLFDLFLLERDTPTPTPMAMTAMRATRAPVSCGNRTNQPSSHTRVSNMTKALARGQDNSPPHSTAWWWEDAPSTLTCDLQTAASPATAKKKRVARWHRGRSSCCPHSSLSDLCLKECKWFVETGSFGSSGNRRRDSARTTVVQPIEGDFP